jgi:hypothetical protein
METIEANKNIKENNKQNRQTQPAKQITASK